MVISLSLVLNCFRYNHIPFSWQVHIIIIVIVIVVNILIIVVNIIFIIIVVIIIIIVVNILMLKADSTQQAGWQIIIPLIMNWQKLIK